MEILFLTKDILIFFVETKFPNDIFWFLMLEIAIFRRQNTHFDDADENRIESPSLNQSWSQNCTFICTIVSF